MKLLLLAAVYGWLGFTLGYFFRKWLERRWMPGYQQTQETPPPASTAEQVDWIDEEGHVLGVVSRAEMRARNLLHRVTATLVFHPDGRLFVHQRTWSKDVYPGRYDLCVGGTVVSGEHPAGNAVRELEEELGVTGTAVLALFTHRFADSASNSEVHVFACVSEGPFRLQAEEVLHGDWRTEAQLDALIAEGQMCPDSVQGWQRYQQRFGRGQNFAESIAPQLAHSLGSGARY